MTISLYLAIYTVFVTLAGFYMGRAIEKFQAEKRLHLEYRRSEELREVINGLLNEMSLNIEEALTPIDEVFDYEKAVK